MNISRVLAVSVSAVAVFCGLTACTGLGQDEKTNYGPRAPVYSATTYESLPLNKNVTFEGNPTRCSVLQLNDEDGSAQLMYGAFFDDLDPHKLALGDDGHAAIDYESAVKLFDRCPEWSEPLDVKRPIQVAYFYVGPHSLA